MEVVAPGVTCVCGYMAAVQGGFTDPSQISGLDWCIVGVNTSRSLSQSYYMGSEPPQGQCPGKWKNFIFYSLYLLSQLSFLYQQLLNKIDAFSLHSIQEAAQWTLLLRQNGVCMCVCMCEYKCMCVCAHVILHGSWKIWQWRWFYSFCFPASRGLNGTSFCLEVGMICKNRMVDILAILMPASNKGLCFS